MEVIEEVDQAGWHGEFYFSKKPAPVPVSWAKTYGSYFKDGLPTNRNHFAAFVFTKGTTCYVVSYGKTHFYIRPYCDYDFGIEVAKRIANEEDTRLTASRRFQGVKKKDIKSFASNTRLDIESGESVDYIQAGIVATHSEIFGKSGKFGTSVQLAPAIEPPDLGAFLDKLLAEIAKPERFKLPRTTIITEKSEIARFDKLLIKELTAKIGTSDFSQNGFDLYGVDFVFGSEGTFVLRGPGRTNKALEQLTMKDRKQYIADNGIKGENVLNIKVDQQLDDGSGSTEPIKELVDFIADKERVLLTGGKWMHFNQDYLEFLDEYLRGIKIEEVEPEFQRIVITEPEFNTSSEINAAGYEVADKNFKIFKTRRSTPVEAWDLRKGNRVYAVKFGTPQKLNYVCDQATGLLEMLRNRAGVTQVPNFDSYCLWIGYRATKPLTDITASGSIIFKQKVDTWARKARELGIEPLLKISWKDKEDLAAAEDVHSSAD